MLNAKREIRLFLFLLLGAACLIVLIEVGRTVPTQTICGTVVDESGAPLDGVTVGVRYYVPPPYPKFFNLLFYSRWPDTPSWNRDRDIYQSMSVDGEFRVRDKALFRRGEAESIHFAKEGYYTEEYRIGQKYEVTADGKKVSQWSDMRVVMRKEPPPPRKVRTLEHVTWGVWYDIANQRKRVLEFPDSGVEVVLRDIPFGQEPEADRYFELDFLRDEWGEIVLREFPGVVDDWGDPIQYPAVFIVRLRSDDPDDGILLVGEGESILEKNLFDGRIRPFGNGDEYKKERDLFRKESESAPARFLQEQTMAPEDGYTRREISIPIEEVIRIWDNNGLKSSSYRAYRTVFVRVAGHYAKACFLYDRRTDSPLRPVDSEAFSEDFNGYIKFDMYLNPKKGSRHLSEYRESRKPNK